MSQEMLIAFSALACVLVIALAALAGWQGWLSLKLRELESHRGRGQLQLLLQARMQLANNADGLARQPNFGTAPGVERRMRGLDVFERPSGRQGLHVFQERHELLKLVLLDLTMPILSGEESHAEMVRIDASVPVIFMSGFIGTPKPFTDLVKTRSLPSGVASMPALTLNGMVIALSISPFCRRLPLSSTLTFTLSTFELSPASVCVISALSDARSIATTPLSTITLYDFASSR